MKKTPEGEFRDYLDRAMRGLWLMTWHEDREINPGVPDVSYVMNGLFHETGWLELKAIRYDEKKEEHKFTLEPSQHAWFEAHCKKIPVHLLLCLGDHFVFLVDSSFHKEFVRPLTIDKLRMISTATIPKSDLRFQLPDHLKRLTDRRRNV